MWSGTLDDVPDGWALCDGENGTPDLRDKFIYGWTDGVDPGDTGGTVSHLHGVQSHTHDVQLWANYYWQMQVPVLGRVGGAVTADVADPPWGGTWGYWDWDEPFPGMNWTQDTLHVNGGGAYEMAAYKDMLGVNGQTGSTGGATNNANHLPPYYKLAFITKL
jgi:hypothetical protein